MPQKAVNHANARQQSIGDIRRAAADVRHVQNGSNEQWQEHEAGQKGCPVDSDGFQPLPQIVSPGFEDENLVAEIGSREVDGDRNDLRSDHLPIDIGGVSSIAVQQIVDTGKHRIAEDSVPSADGNVEEELPGWNMVYETLDEARFDMQVPLRIISAGAIASRL